jgi:O-antigen/teichoic acid export membrane protein
MGADAYGAYAYAVSWLFLLTLPVGIGLNIGGVRFLAEYASADAWRYVRGYLVLSLWVTLASAGVITIVGLAVVFVARNDVEPAYFLPLVVALLGLPIMGFVSLAAQVGRAFGWVAVAYAPSQVLHPLLMLAGVLVYGTLGLELSARDAVALSMTAFGTGLLVQAVILGRRLLPKIRGLAASYDPRNWLRTAGPLLLVDACWALMMYTDIVMIGAYLTPADTAHYHAAVRTGILVTFFYAAVLGLVGPTFAELHGRGRLREIQEVLTGVMPWMLGPSLATLAVLAVAGPLLLGLFGEGFAVAYPAMIVLAIGGVLNTAMGPASTVLNMTGHQDATARVLAVSAILNVLLNAVMIPLMGIVGAAVATSTTMVGQALVTTWLVRRQLGLQSSVLAMLPSVAARR